MKTTFSCLFGTLFAFCILLSPGTGRASAYTSLYAFGDSLTDVGNDYAVTFNTVPDPTIYTDGTNTGRFTNGLNYLDVLAGDLGLGPLAPSMSGGTDYAYGGARTNSIPVPGGLSFNAQVAAYNSTHAVADLNALYVLWIGANDMSDAIKAAALDPSSATTIFDNSIGSAMSSIGNAIATLAGLGTEHFLVPNLPDLALTPAIGNLNNSGLDFLANSASTSFNAALASTLAMSAFSSLDIRNLDIYGALNDIVANPAAYGFTNVSNSCYTGEVDGTALASGPNPPTICGNPDQYVFWDYEHPTAALDARVGALAFGAVVPEPSTLALLGLGIAGLGYARRKNA